MYTEDEVRKIIEKTIIKMRVVYATKCENKEEANNLITETKNQLIDAFGLGVED